MFKNTRILIIYLHQGKHAKSDYVNSIRNFKCKFVEIFKCNILLSSNYVLLQKNVNKYFGEEY